MTPAQKIRARVISMVVLPCVSLLTYPQSVVVVNTLFTVAPQEQCPMKILQVSHTSSDYLSGAKIRSQTLNQIESYRVGWVILFPTGKMKLDVGKTILIKNGLKPGEVDTLPAQKISPIPEAAEVRFFIAETTWQGGGWKQDLKEMESSTTPEKHTSPSRVVTDPGDGTRFLSMEREDLERQL